jgi:hypothetical protein
VATCQPKYFTINAYQEQRKGADIEDVSPLNAWCRRLRGMEGRAEVDTEGFFHAKKFI